MPQNYQQNNPEFLDSLSKGLLKKITRCLKQMEAYVMSEADHSEDTLTKS